MSARRFPKGLAHGRTRNVIPPSLRRLSSRARVPPNRGAVAPAEAHGALRSTRSGVDLRRLEHRGGRGSKHAARARASLHDRPGFRPRVPRLPRPPRPRTKLAENARGERIASAASDGPIRSDPEVAFDTALDASVE